MQGVKVEVVNLLEPIAKIIIDEMGKKYFDSHEFIMKVIKINERGYVEALNTFVKAENGIFRSFHSQIGRYLSEQAKSGKLNIISYNQTVSENIKDYNSSNEKWEVI